MKDSIEKLAELFKELPGVGERQARRFVLALMRRSPAFRTEIAERISKLSNEVAQCPDCFRYFQADGNEKCDICASIGTERNLLMVVEKDADIDSVRASRNYHGLFFVLDILIPINDEKIVKASRVDKLLKKIASSPELEEIILGFPMNPSGDHTDLYLRETLKNKLGNKELKITSLGRGLSTGTELEYIDAETLKNALKNRA